MHSTSFNTSHDRSTDSTSLQRSGLSMAVGDTKSIVLALQALQDKIRRLEQDRNFHQEQCETAHKKHEAYKLEVETQLDAERAQHRQREQELHELLARANAERARLQATLEDSKQDLGTFRVELEKLLEHEREQAKVREENLRDELDMLRSEVQTEKRQADEYHESIEKLKAEREIVQSTNRRLESTVRDLIAVNNNLMDTVKKGGHAVLNSGAKRSTSNSRRVDPNASALSSARRAPSPARRPVPARNHSYLNPTHSSALRDVRTQGGDMPPVRVSTPTQRSSSAQGRPRSLNTSVATQNHQHSEPGARDETLDNVYEELQNEHRRLIQQYKVTIREAADNETPPEVLNAKLNDMMTQIDRKAEQLRLMRMTQQVLTTGGGASQQRRSMSRGAALDGGVQEGKAIDKVLHKNQIVGELRALFAKAGNYQ